MVARRHLVGEDAPRWLVAGIGVLGATVVGAGAWALTARNGADGTAAGATPVVAGVTVVPPTTTTAAATGTTVAVSAASTTAAATTTTSIAPTTAPSTAASPASTLDPVSAGICPAPVTVLFEFGMTHPLAGPDDPALLATVAWLAANPVGRIVVTGHASSIGEDVDNLLLSFQRATAMATLLRSMGVPDAQIAVRAAGELDPLPGEDPESAANQRVVVRGDAPVCEEVR